ncbi:MAG: PstS family phosphate ABC transporter substrate-binding protein [Cyanobacteria bacterium J06592_8]
MSQTKETRTIFLALLTTLGLIGVCFWGLLQIQGFSNPSVSSSRQDSSANSQSPTQSTSSSSPSQTFGQVYDVPRGRFNYGGGTSWNLLRESVDPVIEEIWPQFKLRYTLPPSKSLSSTTGIEMLLDNQLAFALSSRSLKQEEHQKAQQKGFPLQEIPVAIHAIAVVINPQLKIPGLTVSQLRDIYLGKITNWNQVGGPNLAITPYSRTSDSGTVDFFFENVLKGEDFSGNVEFINTTTLAINKLGNNLGGIYYDSAPKIVEQCTVRPLAIGLSNDEFIPPYQLPLVSPENCPEQRNQLNQEAFQSGEYPMTKRLFVIVKQNGQIDQQAGEAYANLLLTLQGQDLLEQAGYTRIIY